MFVFVIMIMTVTYFIACGLMRLLNWCKTSFYPEVLEVIILRFSAQPKKMEKGNGNFNNNKFVVLLKYRFSVLYPLLVRLCMNSAYPLSWG